LRSGSDAKRACVLDDQVRRLRRQSTPLTVTSSSPGPIDLGRLISSRHPIRHVRYEFEEVGEPTLATVLEPILAERGSLVAAH
jgi:hypothetical protein